MIKNLFRFHARSAGALSVVIFSLLIALPLSTPLSFSFTSFDESSLAKIDLLNDSQPNNNMIELTKYAWGSNIQNSTGRAVSKEPLLLWDEETLKLTDFTTHFVFSIHNDFNGLSHAGDGLAFFLSPYPSSAVSKYSAGGSLGLYSWPPAIGNDTVAVEFDTYFNDVFDPPGDSHVGIDIKSINSTQTAPWKSINNGTDANSWVTYNASTCNLSVYLTYAVDPVFSDDYHILSYKINLQQVLPTKVAIGFSAATGLDGQETHTIKSWSFNSTLQPKTLQPRKKSKTTELVVSLVVGSCVLMAVLGLLWFIFLGRKNAKRNLGDDEEGPNYAIDDHEFDRESGPKKFSYKELARATNKFSEAGKLGEGGFGSVYRGFLKDLKLDVAIKRVSRGSNQGRKEYVSEVKIISRLRHRNLVQLVGWCHDHEELLLVYELLPNGSLDCYLHSSTRILEWQVRHNIAKDLASALLYLHEEWQQCVVHRDIKPSNVMLDSEFNAKLGDFGLARLVDHNNDMQTTLLAGTFGYLAPEYISNRKATKSSDVYSFGIVALQIASGRKAILESDVTLVKWVWELHGMRKILEAADEKLQGNFDEKQMECLLDVGLWCAHPDHQLRPSIKQAINVLNFEAPLPELPPEMPVPVYWVPSTHILPPPYTSSSSATSTLSASFAPTGSATSASISSMSSTSSQTVHLLKSTEIDSRIV